MLRQSLKILLLAVCFIAAAVPMANAQAVNQGVPAQGCTEANNRNWSGCVPTPGVAIPFCTIDARTGVQGIKQLTQEGYNLLIQIGSIRACNAVVSCNEALQIRNVACPSGQNGNITEQRTVCVGGDINNNTAWTETGRTCVATCTQGTETSTTRRQCPQGQSGVITDQRVTNVNGVCNVFGEWAEIGRTCASTCTQGTETRSTTPCPSGQSGVINESRTTNTGGVCNAFGPWTETSRTCGLICTTPWGQQVNNGGSVTAFQADSVLSNQTCVSETRTCTNGNLSGSFEFQNCVNNGCTQTVENRTLSCPVGETGVGIIQNRTVNRNGVCNNNGEWTEVTRACEPVTCPRPWGGAPVLFGQSVTAFQAASAATCVSQTRTCQANGQLSGSFTFQSCTPTCAPQTISRTSTPCPSGQVGVITETRELNRNSVCGNDGDWTVQSNTCQPQVTNCNITLQAGNYINLNLYQLAQQQQCPIVPGVNVTLTILEGATIGSNSVNFASFTTGINWPSNVVLKVINKGRILGKGGDGAYAYLDGTPRLQAAQAGGPAVDAPHPMTFDNSDGEVWGGGGGGGTINFAHCSPAGGGGAGYVIGNTFIPNMECTVNGSSSREGKRLNGEIATRTTGAGNEYMIRQIGNDVNAAYYVSGPGGAPGQAGGNAAFYVRTPHVGTVGSPNSPQDIIIGYYYYTPTQLNGTGFNTGGLTGGDAGYALVNPQNITFTGADNGDRRGRDYPINPPRRPTPQPPLTGLTCTQATESRTVACATGFSGTRDQQRVIFAGNSCDAAPGEWQDINTSRCVATCTPGSESRTRTENVGAQVCTINETRSTNVNGVCGTAGLGQWTETSRNCVTPQEELVILLGKPKTVTNGQVTAWDYYPYCTDHYAAIGLEYNPYLPNQVDVVLITGSQDGQLGKNCGGTGNTGRLKFGQIDLPPVAQTGQTFSLTAKFYANINGAGCGYVGSTNAQGRAVRNVTINVNKANYSTSYVSFVYDTNTGQQLTGSAAATAVLTGIPCIPYADFTGLGSAGLFGVCPNGGQQVPGYFIMANKYITIN